MEFIRLRGAAYRALTEEIGYKGLKSPREVSFGSVARLPIKTRHALVDKMMADFKSKSRSLEFVGDLIHDHVKESDTGLFSLAAYVVATCVLDNSGGKDAAHHKAYDEFMLLERKRDVVSRMFRGVDKEGENGIAAQAQFVYAQTQSVDALVAYCSVVGGMATSYGKNVMPMTKQFSGEDRMLIGAARHTMGSDLMLVAWKAPSAFIQVCNLICSVDAKPPENADAVERNAACIEADARKQVLAGIAASMMAAPPALNGAERAVCLQQMCTVLQPVDPLNKGGIAAILSAILRLGGSKALITACMALEKLPAKERGTVASSMGQLLYGFAEDSKKQQQG
jgi:hypothetical protein